VCQKRAITCQHTVKRGLLHVSTPKTDIIRRTRVMQCAQKRPVVCQKRPTSCQKSPISCQKRPISSQKRPIVCQKRPIACQHTQDRRHETLCSHAMCPKKACGVSKEANHSHKEKTEAYIEYVSSCVCVLVCSCVCVCVFVCMCVRV